MTESPQIDFTKVAELGNDLLLQLNEMREAAPIIWSESARGWMVTRHADVLLGFSGRLPLSNVRFDRCFNAIPEEERKSRLPITMRSVPFWIVNADPPLHTRLRKLLIRAFSKKVVESLRPFVKETIGTVLDKAEQKNEIEFINDVARAITGRVIMKWLGVPEANLSKLEEWSYNLNTAFGSAQPAVETLEAVERSLEEMGEVFNIEIDQRRREPTEDFLSEMITAREGSDALTEDEILGVCYVTLIAGHDTTMNSMALGIAALGRDPEAREYLMNHSDEMTNCVMEVARISAMSTAQPRIVVEDFEWHGQQLRKSDVVYLMIAGANRDPRVFADPEQINMSRPTTQVLSFGAGLHHCIGHLLAKMQMGEFFPEFIQRFPSFTVLDRKLRFSPSLSQRGLEYLHVRLNTAGEPPQ